MVDLSNEPRYRPFSSFCYHFTMLRGKLTEEAIIDPRDVDMMQILLKIAREGNSSKADNWVDLAGYTNTMYRMMEATQDERNGSQQWNPSIEEMFGYVRNK